MHSDPVADLLTRIRNGYRARLPRVASPSSKLKLELLRVLKAEGYVKDYTVDEAGPRKMVSIELRYDEQRRPAVSSVRRVSKPGLRVYMGCEDLPRVRSGMGTLVLTTSKGVMTDREARKQKLGGEALCTIW